MKKFRIRLNSIGSKLTIAFMALLLVPSIFISIFSYESAKANVNTQISNATTQYLSLLNSQIDSYIGLHQAEVQAMAAEVAGSDAFAFKQIIERNVKAHPEIESTFVASSNSFITTPPVKQKIEWTKRPWYTAALQNPGKVIVSDPFVSGTGNLVVSVAAMTPDQKYIVGETLRLKQLFAVTSQVKVGMTGTVFILDQHNTYLYSAVLKAGTKDTTSPQIKAMYSSDSGEYKYMFKGQQKDLLYQTNKTTRWKLAGTMAVQDQATAAAPILRVTLIVLIIAVILGALVVVFVVRTITKPMCKLVTAAKKIGDGHLTEEIQIQSRDEFGQLGDSFDQMRESLRSVLYDVSNTSQQVAASAEELMASSEQSGLAAQNIAETIQEVAVGTDKQTRSVEESTVVVHDMSSGIQQIAANAQRVSSTATDASNAAAEGEQSIASVVAQMNDINTTVSNLARSIEKLGARSQEIGDIVDVITGISSQTNLLSLNASIEAARAGEHGRGFAVVADEIRKLAEESQSSAQQIGDLVKAIQSDTRDAVAASSSTNKAVDDGMNAVEVAGKSFATINQSVSTVADQIQEVSAAVEKLLASSDGVTKSIRLIAEVAAATAAGTQNVSAATEEQLASMEEIAASSSALAKMAEELQNKIAKFEA